MLITFEKKLHYHVIIVIAYLLFGIIEAKGNTSEVNDSSRSKFSVKINLILIDQNQFNNANLDNFSPSFLIRNKRGDHFEFGLLSLLFGLDHATRGDTLLAQVRFGSIGLKSQYNFRIIKRQVSVEPYLSGALAFYYYHTKHIPALNYSYYIFNKYTAVLSLTPGVRWNISQRVFLDFEAHIPTLSFLSIRSHSRDPSLLTFGPDYSIDRFEALRMNDFFYYSLGLGFKL